MLPVSFFFFLFVFCGLLSTEAQQILTDAGRLEMHIPTCKDVKSVNNTEQLHLTTSKHELNLRREKHITQQEPRWAYEKSRLHSFSGSHFNNPQFIHLVVWLLRVFTFGVSRRKMKTIVADIWRKSCRGRSFSEALAQFLRIRASFWLSCWI